MIFIEDSKNKSERPECSYVNTGMLMYFGTFVGWLLVGVTQYVGRERWFWRE